MKYILILFFVIGCESKPINNGYGHGLDTVYITDDLYIDTSIIHGSIDSNIFYDNNQPHYTATYDSLGNIYFKEK